MAKRKPGIPAEATEGQAAAGSPGRILEEYLTELRMIRSSGAGVAETSYYPALARMLDAVGKTLRPKVRCVMGLKDLGAGLPDGGLFTADQFPKGAGAAPKAGQVPSRGAIEAKGTRPAVGTIAASRQVKDYLGRYGIVLVTNLREFLILERGGDGRPVEREAFRLAEDEQDFWQQKAGHPRATAQQQGAAFVEFIARACLHAAPLVNPKDVAWFLASYARDALRRVEERKDLPALQAIRAALEDALGMKFSEEKGEHFFRSTLVQTLFYGVFSAWVLWHRQRPGRADAFNWHEAEWSLHVPFIRTLYHEIAGPERLAPLGLVGVLDLAAGVLNRVQPGEFFQRFQDDYAVQYFYEPFLEAYDPELRKELGVWLTPPEIVKYQVARVDAVLREELGLAEGLADPNVLVLDPCCGTGAYLVEVLRRIAATLRQKWGDTLVPSDLKRAAMTRVFGFEIMPAPFVVSHLQLGLALLAEGAPLSDEEGDRVGVYLTNALTGWEPPKGPKQRVAQWAELDEERHAAEHVKQSNKILVVLGNPPYNAFAGVSPEEEEGLVEVYKGVYCTEKRNGANNHGPNGGMGVRRLKRYTLNDPPSEGGWGIKKFNLDDLYVRFLRLAERRICEMNQPGCGVVSFISNFSYLGDPSFLVMRQRFLAEFDKLWFDCMNGDSRETGKLTPDGRPDPSVFSTDYNREGIRVGTAVCVMVRKPVREKKPAVRFRHFWGVNKRADLLATSKAKGGGRGYKPANPRAENRFSFRPENVAAEYTEWPRMVELCEVAPSNGLMEKRGGALIDIDRDALEIRMRDYFDAGLSWEEYKARHTALTGDAARFRAQEARSKAVAAGSFQAKRLCRYALRPFDTRWCYYTPVRPVWNEPRPALWRQRFPGNAFLMTRPAGVADPEGAPFGFARYLGDNDYQRGHAYYFPIRITTAVNGGGNGLLDEAPTTANLSATVRAYLAAIGIIHPDADTRAAGLIWMHALAVGYSPAYLTENADGVRRDWPRIPLPADRKALEASASLGEQIAALLDTEADVPGVTSGKIARLLKTVGLVSKTGGRRRGPAAGELAITAGWGHAGKAGATMPAKGRIEHRAYHESELQAMEAQAAGELSASDIRRLLGERTCNVYLNEIAYWRNIPLNVWEYRIGGYQVIKKWLSYRELELLGRALRTEEAREVTTMGRRIAAIILMQPALDANYQAVKAAAYAWPGGGG
jgi:hypothetical protein